MSDMIWSPSHRADPEALPVADRHYNRQKPGTPQFVPPGRCMVLKHRCDGEVRAVWVTSWPFAEYVKHAWAGAWINTMFRKECACHEASDMILEAVRWTGRRWIGPLPDLGLVTFIDPKHVKPRMIRGRPTYGHAYFQAGFRHVGYTKGGLWAFQLLPADMPPVGRLPPGPLFAEANDAPPDAPLFGETL